MFKLESYITPWLLSYIDQYVKLRREDFQLSLWGGDVVFSNLELRLANIQKLVPTLPIVFQSGVIHELRIHIPWMRINSEPIVVTINQIELVIVLNKERTPNATDTSSSFQREFPSDNVLVQQQQPSTAEQSNYVQTVLARILNNVEIVVNNLIVKFIEENIVISLSSRTAQCYAVNGDWNKAFIELTQQDLSLRRLITLPDITLCLDKRDIHGKVHRYEVPLLSRCSFDCRMQMFYSSIYQQLQTKPAQMRLSFHCANIEVSVVDSQLSMIMRLTEIIMILVNQQLHSNDDQSENNLEQMKNIPLNETTIEPIPSTIVEITPVPNESIEPVKEDQNQGGWVSWAWSYVPSVTTIFAEDDPPPDEADAALPVEQLDKVLPPTETPTANSNAPTPILFAGIDLDRISLQYKVTKFNGETSRLVPFIDFTVQQANIIVERYKPTSTMATDGQSVVSSVRKVKVSTASMELIWDEGLALSLGDVHFTLHYDRHVRMTRLNLSVNDLNVCLNELLLIHPCTATLTLDHLRTYSLLRLEFSSLTGKLDFNILAYLITLINTIRNIIDIAVSIFRNPNFIDEINDDIISVDDLRNGSMKCLFDSSVELPNTNEILFSSSLMTWKYSQRRSILKCHILPLPFDDDLNGVAMSHRKKTVGCLMQYWHFGTKQFLTWQKFDLSDGEPLFLDFSHELGQSPYSDMWRIVLVNASSIIQQANSLAASTRIDSLESQRYEPSIEIVLLVPNIRVHFMVTPQNQELSAKFQSILDGCPHDVLTLNLDNVSMDFSQRLETKSISIETTLSLDALEYRFLTKRSCLEPTLISVALLIDTSLSSVNSSSSAIFDAINGKYGQIFRAAKSSIVHQVAIHIDHINIRLSQSLCHLINILYQHCMRSDMIKVLELKNLTKQVLALTANDDPSYYTYYLFTNHLNCSVGFKQFGTNDNFIYLKPHLSTDFTWSKVNCEQLLVQFALEHGSDESFVSPPLSLSEQGQTIVYFEQSPHRFHVHINLDEHRIRRHIHLTGPLIVKNICNVDLRVTLLLSVGSTRIELFVSKNGSYVSCLQTIEDIQAIQWNSSTIHSIDSLNNEGILSSSDQMSLWIHFIQNDQSSCLIFAPFVVYRSYLTQPIQLHLNAKKENNSEMSIILEPNGYYTYFYNLHSTHTYEHRLQQLDAFVPTQCVFELNHQSHIGIEQVENLDLQRTTKLDFLLQIKVPWTLNSNPTWSSSVIDLLQEQHVKYKQSMDEIPIPLLQQNSNSLNASLVPTIGANGPSMYEPTISFEAQKPILLSYSSDLTTNSIDCRIEPVRLYSHLNTILIQLKPSTLVNNCTPFNFHLHANAGHDNLYIGSHQLTCLSKLIYNQIQFVLIDPYDGEHIQCQSIELFATNIPMINTLSSIGINRLYTNSIVDLNFIKSSNSDYFLFRIQHEYLDQTHILTIKPKYIFHNRMNQHLTCHILPMSKQQQHTIEYSLNIIELIDEEQSNTALYRFQGVPSSEIVHYLLFEVRDVQQKYARYISKPIKLTQSTDEHGTRQCLCVFQRDTLLQYEQTKSKVTRSPPASEPPQSMRGELLTVVQSTTTPTSSVYIHISPNPAWSFVQIVNSCPCSLLCRLENITSMPHILPPFSSTLIGIDAVELAANINSISHQNAVIATRFFVAQFPFADSIKKNDPNAMMKLITAYFHHLTTNNVQWSRPVKIDPQLEDVFLPIPGLHDVLIRSLSVSFFASRTLIIEPVHRQRSIKTIVTSKSNPNVQTSPESGASIISETVPRQYRSSVLPHSPEPINQLSSQFVKAWQQQFNQANHRQLQLLVNVDKVSVSIMDELNDICLFREILRVTIDKINLCFHQRIVDVQPILYQRQLLGSIDQLQIDNQCYSPKENYDFPVVLMSKDETRVSKTKTDIYANRDRDGSTSNNLSRIQRQNSSSSIDTTMTEETLPAIDSSSYNHKISRPISAENDPDEAKFVTLRFHRINHRFISLEFEMQPFDVYLEDHYIYVLLNMFSHLLPLDLRTPMRLTENDPRAEFIDNHLMTVPFVCESLSISSIDIVVSIHASMKVYIGCHQLPMFVDKFQRNYVFSTQRQLLTLISRHYIVALLTRSPLLLGSFDLLGNPSVLIRNLTDGIYDLFHLPYIGMRRGPSGFMMGISEGATSLLKHLSLGTLTSLTTFANSVARNMDRLAMDSEHSTRNEETCRQIPTGMTDGLLQGLELFSLSLLGAIAGLAEQPMASFRNRPESQAATTTVLSGVGKGLVGVVVKPVGGVAQLISQTGQGILYGTGLMNIPHRRHRQLEQRVTAHAGISYLKLHRCCSITDKTDEIIDTLDYVLEHSLTEQGVLVLTKNGYLIIYHKDDESQHGEYALDNVDLRESLDSNAILVLDNLSLYVDARHRSPFLALCRQIRR